tara:strand:+ start:494 stop:757 length:264 start_codon:yes stop_codon:yes gene_type:complete
MNFIIENFLIISLVFFIKIQFIFWILNKVENKKEIKMLNKKIEELNKIMEIIEDNLNKLRESNHKIANIVYILNLKNAFDEKNNNVD